MPQNTSDTPLVGREEEFARLAGLLERARAGEARAVLIAGDAGVGKTRLLSEATSHAAEAGMTVVTGHCVDLGDVGLPYLPFTEVLGTLAADERFATVLAAHPGVERLLGAGPGPEAGSSRLQFLEDMASLLADLAEVSPIFLVLEDLHWADQSTRDLLRFLLSRAVLQRAGGGAPAQRLAICASYRTDDLHRRHPLRPLLAELVRLPAVERLELRPLADAEVARLLRTLHADRGGSSMPESTVRRIVERAEGNAFFAEELLAATGGGADELMPGVLADVLLIRFEQLSGTAQQVLRTAAVAGRRVDHALLREAVELPDEELESALREAVGRQILAAGERDTYSFRHALSREAVYADLLPGERVRLHGMFAKLLAGRNRPDSAAERAHHARESHDLPAALGSSLEAADHAAQLGAPAEELRHIEAALDLWEVVEEAQWPEDVDEVTLMLRASAAAARAGEAHRAVSLTRGALARVGSAADSELGARIRYTLATHLMRVDNLAAAFEYSREALAMIPAEPPTRTWVWAAATHVLAASYVAEKETAGRVARQAIAVAEELGVRDAQADLMISLVGIEGPDRRTPGGRERLQQARELARSSGNTHIELRAMFNLAIGCFESSLLDECLSWLTEGLDVARRAGLISSPYAQEMRYVRSLLLYTLGRWDECVEAASSDAERMPATLGFVSGPALYVALGRGEQGVVERARALLAPPFDWMNTLIGGITLTDEAALRGDAKGAVEQAQAALDALIEPLFPRPGVGIRIAALALAPVADAAVERSRSGDEAGARSWTQTADELREMARATVAEQWSPQGPEGQAWQSRVEAEWARATSSSSIEAWERAAKAFGSYGDVYEEARSRRRLAEALLAAERREEAAEHARAVREVATRLGAVRLLEDIEALIRRGRLAPEATSDRAAVLTARERDVLLLLALGRTNRQIGEELFISGKTASVHVSNILAKLGAAGRTEAVAIAYRQGLIEPEPRGSQ